MGNPETAQDRPSGDTAIRVLVADDHPLILKALRQTLAFESDLAVVGEAADGEAVQYLARKLQPDVLLLDLVIPGPSPQAILTYLQLHAPQTRVVILTAYDDGGYVRDLIAAGVAGYVLKNEAAETVVDAVRTVMQGRTWFSPSVMHKLTQPHEAAFAPTRRALTDQELVMLQMVASGNSDREIGAALAISERTVRYRLQAIYDTLGVDSRAQAVAQAVRLGLVEAG